MNLVLTPGGGVCLLAVRYLVPEIFACFVVGGPCVLRAGAATVRWSHSLSVGSAMEGKPNNLHPLEHGRCLNAGGGTHNLYAILFRRFRFLSGRWGSCFGCVGPEHVHYFYFPADRPFALVNTVPMGGRRLSGNGSGRLSGVNLQIETSRTLLSFFFRPPEVAKRAEAAF